MVITITRKPQNAYTRTLGYCSQPAKTVDNFRVLMTSLNDKKGSKYKISNIPYIISVSVDDMSASEEDFAHVLFGPNYIKRLFINERSNGFFLREGRPQNTSVSAVLFCERFTVFGLMGSTFSLWHNPYATHKLTLGHFPFKEVVYREDGNILHQTVVEKQTNVFEFLGIDKEKYLEAMRFENRKSPER